MKAILLVILITFSAKGFSQYDLLILKNYKTGKIIFIPEGKMVKLTDGSKKSHKGILSIKCDSAQCHNPLLLVGKDSVYLDNVILIRTKAVYAQVSSGVMTVSGTALGIEGSYFLAMGLGLNTNTKGMEKYTKSVMFLNGGAFSLGGLTLITAGVFLWNSFAKKFPANKWEYFAQSPIAHNGEPDNSNQTSTIAP
ncbi:hypothetical protein [Parabacteroides sp. FAFU027]|uniref:hypothetical protein n=1 Tax=Parabacteroides sp. FAFU027 TaxID=2922715 RepID=UPI001FAF326D|nr:hypothetical protein [Parabacteroides sp. FAFU027]